MDQTIDLAVRTKGLVKQFGSFTAVDSIDLAIEKGTVYGFLGPNGAGKTTTVRMLSTLLKIDEGEAHIFGYDVTKEPKKIRPRIALTGQHASIDENLTGTENLVMICRLMGFKRKEAKQRAAELLEAFGLSDAASKQAKNYSGGMRRRLDIAASIVITPDLLFLDEPTTGLDPRSRNQVWEVVRALTKAGTTVLLTTQYLDEADQLADRIAVINKGAVIAEGTPSELKASVGSGMLHITLKKKTDIEQAEKVLETRFDALIRRSSRESEIIVNVSSSSEALKALNNLESEGIELVTFSLSQPSLDEVFLALTDDEE